MRVDLDLIDEQLFTKIVEYVTTNLTDPILTDDNFSSKDSDISGDPIFPFVLIKRIVGTETALDLERDTLNGGLFTYEIRVTSNDSQDEAKEIMNYVTRAMKSMKFYGASLPISSDSNNLHVSIARWQRTMHGGDLI